MQRYLAACKFAAAHPELSDAAFNSVLTSSPLPSRASAEAVAETEAKNAAAAPRAVAGLLPAPDSGVRGTTSLSSTPAAVGAGASSSLRALSVPAAPRSVHDADVDGAKRLHVRLMDALKKQHPSGGGVALRELAASTGYSLTPMQEAAFLRHTRVKQLEDGKVVARGLYEVATPNLPYTATDEATFLARLRQRSPGCGFVLLAAQPEVYPGSQRLVAQMMRDGELTMIARGDHLYLYLLAPLPPVHATNKLTWASIAPPATASKAVLEARQRMLEMWHGVPMAAVTDDQMHERLVAWGHRPPPISRLAVPRLKPPVDGKAMRRAKRADAVQVKAATKVAAAMQRLKDGGVWELEETKKGTKKSKKKGRKMAHSKSPNPTKRGR
jgi:hypothetical protein